MDDRYWIGYTDANGKRRTVAGCRDKVATERLARKLEDDAHLQRHGVDDPALGVYANAQLKPIKEHADDYRRYLQAKGNVPRYVTQARQYVLRIIDAAPLVRLSDLRVTAVQTAIASVREQYGLSLQTSNHVLRAIKGFSRWLRRDRRIRHDDLGDLVGFNAEADRKRERRELNDEEIANLIAAAEAFDQPHGMTGVDRAMLYRVALGTGFRVNELRSLVPGSFVLDTEPPTITVAAAYSKRRRTDTQPIRTDLAGQIQDWLVGKPKGGPVFSNMPAMVARMMRGDLKRAGIEYKDEKARVADFHALRHTYISRLVRAGTSVKTAQVMARHSTPTLTIGRYAHADLRDQVAALEALPKV